MKEITPWGFYEVLYDGFGHKVKRLVVKSGHRLSLQYHRMREEHWVVVQGAGVVTNGAETLFVLPGDTVTIEKEMKHRAANVGFLDLELVEVQMGRCIEQDVVRFEDDYGRQR